MPITKKKKKEIISSYQQQSTSPTSFLLRNYSNLKRAGDGSVFRLIQQAEPACNHNSHKLIITSPSFVQDRCDPSKFNHCLVYMVGS